MWLDNASEIDILFYNPYAKYVAKTICDRDNTPLTIGLFGKWGAGKSTLVNLIKHELKANDNTIVVDTNAWLYEGYTDAKTSLMETITQELHDHQSLPKDVSSKCKNLFARINKLKMAKSLLKLGGQAAALIATGNPLSVGGAIEAAKEAVDAFNGDEIKESAVTDIASFRKEFSDLINSLEGKTFVFIVDDLDRCAPERIIDTLEAIKLFLSVKGTVFLIAADDAVIEYSIKQKYPGLNENDYSREYIEKIIQLPITVPVLSIKDIENYLLLLVAQKYLKPEKFSELLAVITQQRLHTRDSSITLDELNHIISELQDNPYRGFGTAKDQYEKDSTVIEGIRATVARALNGNPRQTKRFLNTFIAKKSLAELYYPGEINNAILAKVLALYQISPALFHDLYRWNNEFDGKIPNLRDALDGKNADNNDWYKPSIAKWAQCPPTDIENYPLDRYFYLTRENIGKIDIVPTLSTEGKDILARIVKLTPGTADSVFSALKQMSAKDQSTVIETLIPNLEKSSSPWIVADKLISTYGSYHNKVVDKLASMEADMPALPFYTSLHKLHPDIMDEIKRKTTKQSVLSIIAKCKES